MEDDGYASTDPLASREQDIRRLQLRTLTWALNELVERACTVAGAQRADLRGRDRRLRRLLRPVARHRRALGRRRRGRHRRRPVDRRARHAAHDAHVPHRRRRRRGHHARPAARGGALRGPHAEDRRAPSPTSPGASRTATRPPASSSTCCRSATTSRCGRSRARARRLLPRRAHDAPAPRVADPRHAVHPLGRSRSSRRASSSSRASRSCRACSRPTDLMASGLARATRYLVEEVQRVYRDQGVEINDKHIEVIARQMTRRVLVDHPGSTDWLPGQYVEVTSSGTPRATSMRHRRRRRSSCPRATSRCWASPRRRWPRRASSRRPPSRRRRRCSPTRHRGQDRPPGGPQGERDHRQADPGLHRPAPVPGDRDRPERRVRRGLMGRPRRVRRRGARGRARRDLRRPRAPGGHRAPAATGPPHRLSGSLCAYLRRAAHSGGPPSSCRRFSGAPVNRSKVET